MMLRIFAGVTLALGLAIAARPAAAADQSASYDGLKKTVSVDQFQAAEAVGGTVTADGLTAMLTDALVKDGRFVVVERPGMASVQAEQALGTATSTSAETSAKTGQLIGASAIVRGAVTKYEPAAGGGSLGVGGLPLGSLFGGEAGVKNSHAVLEISLRLVDTTTGQVISTSSAQGTASSTNASATLVNTHNGASLGGTAFQNSPIGQAAQDAIVKAVEQIAAGMKDVPWSALVVDADGAKIYVNAGADRNVRPGLALTVYRKGKVFTDPSTGAVLDVDLEKIGTIRIDGVREKMSTAAMESGQAPVRGDLLRLN
jgi:curli biogenesis system outer membrane secretion channel CsgG